MYVIKRKYEYVYSINNQFGLFSPKWTISKEEALPFKNKSSAQMVADNIREAEVVER